MMLLTSRRLLAFTLLAVLAAAGTLGWRWQPGPWAEAHRESAARLARSGHLAEARAELRRVLARLPADREARWTVIQLELQEQRREQAYLELVSYTELFPERAEGWATLSSLLLAGGLADEALAAASRAVGAAPESAAARAQRARVRAQRGDRAGAVRDSTAALALAPGDPALLQLHRRIESLPVPPAPPEPQRIRDSAGPLRGGRSETHAMVWPGPLAELRRDADLAAQRGDFAAARAVAARAEDRFPGSVIGPWLLGVAAMAQQDPVAAERHFRDALGRAPRSALVTKALAQVWQQRGGAGAAAQQLEALLAADPGHAFARRQAASLWLAARQPDRAELALRAGLDAGGGAEPWLDLARFHLDLDRADEALRACSEGAARFPQDLDLQLLQAFVLAQTGDRDAAIPRLEAALRAAPDRVAERAQLAQLLATRGSPADRIRARQLLEALEAEAPADLPSVDAIGWAWTLSGTASRGLPWLDAAVRAAPGRPALRYHLAAAHARLGQADAARRELDAALASGQPFAERPDAQRLRRRL